MIYSVAVGKAGGRDVIASGGADGAVRCWDAIDGTQIGADLAGHRDSVTSVEMGRVAGRDVIVSGSSDGTVRVWDAATRAAVMEPLRGHGDYVRKVVLGRAWARDVIVAICAEEWVQVWDASTGVPVTVFLADIESLAVGRAGGRDVIVADATDGSVRVWDLGGEDSGYDGAARLVDDGYAAAHVVQLAVINGREVIISASDRGTVLAWDASTWREAYPPWTSLPEGYARLTSMIAGQVGGQDVVVCAYEALSGEDGDFTLNVIEIHNAVTGVMVARLLENDEYSVMSVALGRAAGRDIVVAGCGDGMLRIWDAIPVDATGYGRLGHEDAVAAVAVATAEGRGIVASAARDGSVSIWDVVTGTQIGDPRMNHGSPMTSVAIGSISGHAVVVSGAEDGTLEVSEALTNQKPWSTTNMIQYGALAGVAFGSSGGSAIITATSDGYLQAWCPPFHYPVEAISSADGGVTSVATGKVGKSHVIVTGSQNGRVHVWRPYSEIDSLLVHNEAVDPRLWIDHDEATFSPLSADGSAVNAVAVGRAGERDIIVCCTDGGTIQAWDAVTSDMLLRLTVASHGSSGRRHGALLAVAIGRVDNRDVIVAGGSDGAVRIWDAVTGTPACALLACHDSRVTGVAIGRAGDTTVIASCSEDRSVVVHERRPRR